MEKKNNTAKIYRGFSAIRRVSAGRGFSATGAFLGNVSVSRQRARFSTKVASRQHGRFSATGAVLGNGCGSRQR
ncbi:MAG: hypothetical protein ACI4JT_10130, partial [Oscillospiraceae bacterium]